MVILMDSFASETAGNGVVRPASGSMVRRAVGFRFILIEDSGHHTTNECKKRFIIHLLAIGGSFSFLYCLTHDFSKRNLKNFK